MHPAAIRPAFLMSSRWRAALAIGSLVATLASCGGGDNGSAPNSVGANNPVPGSPAAATANTLSVSLTANGTGSVSAQAEGDNLIDLNGTWLTWSGQNNGITYDATAHALRIPGDGRDVLIGVQRFDVPLTAGVTYTLQVQASDDAAAALLFLFDANGTIVSVPGSTGLSVATNASDVRFVAPVNIAGFYLQVQNRYQATSGAQLSAELIEGSGTTASGVNLINTADPWTDWSGNASGVAAASDGVNIPAPSGGISTAIGVKRFRVPLTQGTAYELSLGGRSSVGTAALLFLIDANGQIVPFTENGQSLRWIAAMNGQAKRFVAPAGIVSFAVQVQGPYRASAGAFVVPSLKTTVSGGTTRTVSVVKTSDDGAHVLFGDGTRQWIDNACLAKLNNIRATVDTVSWGSISGLTPRPGTGDCDGLITQLTAQPPQAGNYLLCTFELRGGKTPNPPPITNQYYAVVRIGGPVAVFERGIEPPIQLAAIAGSSPDPRATVATTGPDGFVSWSYQEGGPTADGGFRPGHNKSVVYDSRTGFVRSYEYGGVASTELAVLGFENCKSTIPE